MDRGEDTEGANYATVDDLWRRELGTTAGREGWYAKATTHWEQQEASINGVLGGYPETNGPDLRESKRFLELLRCSASSPGFGTALDCGAGIGRVTVGLLQLMFEQVDLAEPNARLLEAAQASVDIARAGRFMPVSLQDLEPDSGYYDVIWAQWVLLYLPDDDLVAFLQRCKAGLKKRGVICVKENVVLEGRWVVDREDNSIARTDAQYKAIFKRAGLTMAAELTQTCWPKDLIPVKMYALKPVPERERKHASTVRKKPAAARS